MAQQQIHSTASPDFSSKDGNERHKGPTSPHLTSPHLTYGDILRKNLSETYAKTAELLRNGDPAGLVEAKNLVDVGFLELTSTAHGAWTATPQLAGRDDAIHLSMELLKVRAQAYDMIVLLGALFDIPVGTGVTEPLG